LKVERHGDRPPAIIIESCAHDSAIARCNSNGYLDATCDGSGLQGISITGGRFSL
jgi:hypothetical protein